MDMPYDKIDERYIENAFLYLNIEGTSFLDVGCGESTIALALWELGYDSHAINLTDFRHIFPNFKQGNFLKSDYKDDYFDTVACISVLEHLKPEAAKDMIEKIRTVLRPGGIVIATFPTAGEWYGGTTTIDPMTSFPGFALETVRCFDRKDYIRWKEYDPAKTDPSKIEHSIAVVKARKT